MSFRSRATCSSHRLIAILILAVDDLRLLRMKRQPTVGEPPLQRCVQWLCLLLLATVADHIVGITLERNVRMVPSHPREAFAKRTCAGVPPLLSGLAGRRRAGFADFR